MLSLARASPAGFAPYTGRFRTPSRRPRSWPPCCQLDAAPVGSHFARRFRAQNHRAEQARERRRWRV